MVRWHETTIWEWSSGVLVAPGGRKSDWLWRGIFFSFVYFFIGVIQSCKKWKINFQKATNFFDKNFATGQKPRMGVRSWSYTTLVMVILPKMVNNYFSLIFGPRHLLLNFKILSIAWQCVHYICFQVKKNVFFCV